MIARSTLSAMIDEDEGRGDAAITDLRTAVRLQDGLRPKEPPAWYYPIRESLGARLTLAGKNADAQRVFDEDLRRNPGNPRSLFGLSRALAKTDPAKAAAAESAFRRAWHGAPLALEDL